MMEIERLVFVCPDLEEACSHPCWKKFCISPIRQTRPFIKSCYILFKNIMLELLQVVEHKDAENFVFFEAWKQSRQPTWVSTGCIVNNLELALDECKKHSIDSIEDFVRADIDYEKGFKHRSSLLSKKWCGKHVYLTEYDSLFLDQRLKSICGEPMKKSAYTVKIPSLSLEDLADEKIYDIEKQGRVKLNVFKDTLEEEITSYDFGWIVLHLGIQCGMSSLRKAELSDADAMAYVHATSWQETYTGLLDDHVISKFNVDNRKKMWTAFLQKDVDSQRAYVAVNSGKIVGIASWNETANHVELLTLYVLSEFQSQGIGKSLFKQVEKDAAQKGKQLITWVLKENKATFFYEKMDLKFVKSEEKNLGTTSIQEFMYSNRHD